MNPAWTRSIHASPHWPPRARDTNKTTTVSTMKEGEKRARVIRARRMRASHNTSATTTSADAAFCTSDPTADPGHGEGESPGAAHPAGQEEAEEEKPRRPAQFEANPRAPYFATRAARTRVEELPMEVAR